MQQNGQIHSSSISLSDETVRRLIDRLGDLVKQLDYAPIGGNSRGVGNMYEFWRKNLKNGNYDNGTPDYSSLDKEEQKEWKRKHAENLDVIKEDLERLKQEKEVITQRKKELKEEGKLYEDEAKARRLQGRKLSAEEKKLIKENKNSISSLDNDLSSITKKINSLTSEKKLVHGMSVEEFYDASNKREGTKGMWKRYSPQEQEEFGGSYENYARTRESEGDYYRRTSERKEVASQIYEYGFDKMITGRTVQNGINLQQKVDDFMQLGRILGDKRTVSKIGRAAFGTSKVGAAATKALAGFGKGLSSVTKLLGKFAGPIGLIIQILQFVSDAVKGAYEHQAQMIDFQKQNEANQFNRTKELIAKQQELQLEDINFRADINKKIQEVYGQNMLDAVSMENQAYLAGHSARIGTMMSGITDTIYAAANSEVDIANQLEKFDIDRVIRDIDKDLYQRERSLQYEGKQKTVEAQKAEIEAGYEAQTRELTQAITEYAYQNSNVAGGMGPNFGNVSRIAMGYEANFGGEQVNPFSTSQKVGFSGREEYNTGVEGVTINGRENGNVTPGGIVDRGTTKIPTNNAESEIKKSENYSTVGIGRGTAITGAITHYPLGQLVGADEVGNAVLKYNRAMMELENQRMVQEKEAYTIQLGNLYEVKQAELNRTNELYKQEMDYMAQKSKAELDAAATLKKQYLSLARQIEGIMETSEKTSNDLAKNLGNTDKNSLLSFEGKFMNTARDIFTRWGKTTEEGAALQSAYLNNTGRNIEFGRKDYNKLFAVGQLAGDESLPVEIASSLEIFNKSASRAMDMVEKSMQNVSQYGLNARKYAKDLVKNLQLANKYNFKNGTKGVMEMAKWAQFTRFNMDSLSGMLDKVQEGGIEGVITQAAGFQVLGGHAAINSDPLGMLYDAFADPDAYGKRMQDMTKGFGVFNTKTGETDFNINESMMINQIAKLQGRSSQELRDEIRERNKRARVDKEIEKSGVNFTKMQRALIGSKAHIDKDSGEWVVETDEGRKKVSELTNELVEKITPETHDEAVEDYMKKILSATESLKGEQLFQQYDEMTSSWKSWLDEVQKRLASSHNDYLDNRDKLHTEIEEGMKMATESFKHMIQIANEGNTAIEDASGKIATAANNIGDRLHDLSGVIGAGVEELNRLMGNPLDLSQNANEASKQVSEAGSDNAIPKPIGTSGERSNARAWMSSNGGGEVIGRDFAKLSVDMMNSLSGKDSVDVDKFTDSFRDLIGLGLFNAQEKGVSDTDSPYDILVHLREKYLQGIVSQEGKFRSYGHPVKWEDYAKSDFGKRLEQAINNAKAFNDLTYESFDGKNEYNITKKVNERINSNNFVFHKKSDVESIPSSQDEAYYNEDLQKYNSEVGRRSKYIDSSSNTSNIVGNVLSNGKKVGDAIAKASGYPMVVGADDVVPINDGAVAKTSPNDMGIFAKNGGPFDTLFNGIFNKVSDTYSVVNQFSKIIGANTLLSSVRNYVSSPISKYEKEPIIQNSSTIGNNELRSVDTNNTPSNMSLNINGKIELTGQNGQSVNILGILKENPMFVRQLTEMIVLQMNNNTHGGRNEIFHNRFSHS